MTQDRKIKITAEVDATKAKDGFAEVKAAGADMANSVRKSGQDAGDAVGKIGDGGEQSAQKVDRATRSMIASIQRSTAAFEGGGASSRKYFETLASQRGVSVESLQPYLNALDSVRAKQSDAGVSAAQMQAALRGVPAQFTDIVTSIASGQQPLTVFLQQGGQLKDMFGGAGNAARALGGYVVGLVNPFTLAAAAAGVLGVAYYQGSKEADALARAIIMTGNAAGASVGQLQDMARAVSAGTGATQGAANEAIAAAANSGKIAAGNIELVSAAAIKLNKAVGLEVADTIESFAELGREPVKASEKLNEKYNYLTASIYTQIKALEDQGKTLEAGAVAQKAYADAMSGRADQVIANLGLIEQAWKGITGAAKSGWDAMLGVGRQATIADQIAEQRRAVEAIRSGAEVGNIDVAQKRLAALEAASAGQAKSAAATAEAGRQEQARIAWLKEGDKYLSRAEERERAITRARNEGAAAGLSQIEIEKRVADIREKLADPKGRKPAKSQESKDAEELQRILDRIGGKSTGLDAGYYSDLQKLFKAYSSGKLDLDRYRQSVEQLTTQQEFSKKLMGDSGAVLQDYLKNIQDATAAREKELIGLDNTAASLEDQYRLYGLTKGQIEALALARAEESLAQARANLEGEETIARLEREVEARKRIRDAQTKLDTNAEAARALSALGPLGDKFDLKIDTSSLKSAFSGLGDPLAGVIDKFQTLIQLNANYGKQVELIGKAKLGSADQYAKAVQAEIALNQRMATATLGGYADILSAAKGFVSERSKGYKALQAAEQVFRAFQLATAVSNAAKEIALITGVASAKVAGDQIAAQSSIAAAGQEVVAAQVAGQANAVVAVTNQAAKGDPYSAWIRMAAMAAAMAALGFAVSGAGGGSGPNPASAAEMQARQGTGTVLGDAAAKSNSIANSIDRLSDIDQLTMRYSAQMAASLRNIESSMGGLASIVVRTYGLTTGNITGVQTGISTETFGQSMGALGFMDRITEQALSQLPVIGDLAKGLFSAFGSTKVKLIDSGVQFDQGSIADYIAGLGMSQYGTLETTKKSWFGLSKSSSTNVVNQALDDEIKRQFGLLFASLDTSLVAAANALGVSTGQISEQIQAFQLDMQRLSLKGMNGAEVQEALGNYFSAVFDKVSGSVLPGLEDWQKVGEGYYETLIRVASGADQARYYTEQLGLTMAGLGDVASTQGDAAAELLRASITMAEGQSAIAKIVTGYDGTAQELSDLYGTLLNVQTQIRNIAGSSAEVTTELIRASGGIEALTDNISGYLEAFYTQAERDAMSFNALGDQFAALGLRLPDSTAAFREMVSGIDLTTEAGQRQFANMVKLADAYSTVQGRFEEMLAGINAGFESSIRNVRLSVLDDQGKYTLLDKEASQYRDILASLTDTDSIAAYADKLRGAIDSAWSVLSEDQQKATADEFIQRYEAANTLVNERMAVAREEAIADRKAIGDGIAQAITQGLTDGAAALAEAAGQVPSTITVTVTTPGGVNAVAEVGYS